MHGAVYNTAKCITGFIVRVYVKVENYDIMNTVCCDITKGFWQLLFSQRESASWHYDDGCVCLQSVL